jgi:ABC-type multidrug transport system fused ATPase/permease subunit
LIPLLCICKALTLISTIAGLSVPLIFHPINQIATKYYSQATEDVMKARDQKAHLINEALHGIRQIKFSSMESQWQEIIMAARVEELAAQWRAYLWAVFLMFCWLSMPILLGATALGTYACLNETLTASVAFTALAIFSSLEWTLSVVPTTITELLDGMISIGRIQKHLETKDMQQDIVDRENVGFENACIKWPSNVENDGFVLRDITLDFPRKKLRYC